MTASKHTLLGGVLGAAIAAGIFLLLGAGPGMGMGKGMGMGPGMGMGMGMGAGRPTTMPCAGPCPRPMMCPVPAAMNPGPWHVKTLGGGQSTQPGAILWNSQTGQTWFWWSGTGGDEWHPIKRP